jgi:hypothetical protein
MARWKKNMTAFDILKIVSEASGGKLYMYMSYVDDVVGICKQYGAGEPRALFEQVNAAVLNAIENRYGGMSAAEKANKLIQLNARWH